MRDEELYTLYLLCFGRRRHRKVIQTKSDTIGRDLLFTNRTSSGRIHLSNLFTYLSLLHWYGQTPLFWYKKELWQQKPPVRPNGISVSCVSVLSVCLYVTQWHPETRPWTRGDSETKEWTLTFLVRKDLPNDSLNQQSREPYSIRFDTLDSTILRLDGVRRRGRPPFITIVSVTERPLYFNVRAQNTTHTHNHVTHIKIHTSHK